MRIDVWSDVVCPWCYIGFTRLDKAIEISKLEVEVYHHTYQLDPSAPEEPVSAAQNLAEKYGIDVSDAIGMMERVSTIAEEEGLNYKLAETLHGNTYRAHRLLAYAATVGKQHELLLELFHAYFEKAEPIFSEQELLPFALKVGISEDECKVLFASHEFTDVIDYDKALAQQIGINGVPFFVFDQKVAVPGAESVSVLVQAMQRAVEIAREESDSQSQ